MALYQMTLLVMLLLHKPLHVLGLRVEDTSEYQSWVSQLNGCDDLCAPGPLYLFVLSAGMLPW